MPAESNPPGDIPDNTQFIPFRSTSGHFQIDVPEGWARSKAENGVTFSDKLNSVNVTVFSAGSAPTMHSARNHDAPQLKRTERAFRFQKVQSVTLPGGHAILITFQENSAPNQVTGKQYRLDVLRFEFFKNGREAALTLSSPVGADNVDPWRLISESFKWL